MSALHNSDTYEQSEGIYITSGTPAVTKPADAQAKQAAHILPCYHQAMPRYHSVRHLPVATDPSPRCHGGVKTARARPILPTVKTRRYSCSTSDTVVERRWGQNEPMAPVRHNKSSTRSSETYEAESYFCRHITPRFVIAASHRRVIFRSTTIVLPGIFVLDKFKSKIYDFRSLSGERRRIRTWNSLASLRTDDLPTDDRRVLFKLLLRAGSNAHICD